jgi:hypothetical protein
MALHASPATPAAAHPPAHTMQKVPLRSDSHAKRSAEPTPAKSSSSHHRQFSRDSIPSLDSPFINRRPLDHKTEQELRVACALILKNFKPSDADFADADPKLDFSGPHKSRAAKPDPSHLKVHRPTGAPTEHHRGRDATRPNNRLDGAAVPGHDHPTQANTGRRRAENDAEETRKHSKPAAVDVHRSATIRTDVDSDDARSLGTPLTASTDAFHNTGSTAPTSVAVTSGKSSKRASHQYETAAAAADAQAAEWMRQELEKRRQQQQPYQSRPETSHRPPSRASSIKAGIKEYFIPGSATLSRSQSRDSIRTTNSQYSSQPKRSGSSHGWRSWGLNRRSSSRTSRSNSRPTTSSARVEREQERKTDLNLNRELPPLPSLDTWAEPEQPKQQPKELRKSQLQGAHIATLMRAQDQQQDYAAAVRRHHRRSGSDTMAMRHNNAHAQTFVPLKSPTQLSLHEKRIPKQPPASSMSMDFDRMMSAMSSDSHLDDRLALRPNNDPRYAPHRSTSTLSHSGKPSTDGRLHAPNFSRKISNDLPRPPQSSGNENNQYKNVVHIAGAAGKEEQKSKLRRVLSGWMLRKEKKEDWMGKVEKQGVKNGLMVQEEAALAPVVRY